MKTILAAVAALTMTSGAVAATPAYYGKITAGGTFEEVVNIDTTGPSTGESNKGTGKFSATASFQESVKILLITGSITIVELPHPAISSSMSSTFDAEGTRTQEGQPDSNDHGTMHFSGPTGTATANVLDDFDPNGDNLAWSLGFSGIMHGSCQDDKFGDKCNENTAGGLIPAILGGGNDQPSGNAMQIAGGGGFYAAQSSRQVSSMPSSTDWKPAVCHGDIHSGWTCAFAGSRVWNRAPGVTDTQRVQFNARITITSKA